MQKVNVLLTVIRNPMVDAVHVFSNLGTPAKLAVESHAPLPNSLKYIAAMQVKKRNPTFTREQINSRRAQSKLTALMGAPPRVQGNSKGISYNQTVDVAYRTLRTFTNFKWFGIIGRWAQSMVSNQTTLQGGCCAHESCLCRRLSPATHVFGEGQCNNDMMNSYKEAGRKAMSSVGPPVRKLLEDKIALDLMLFKEANRLFTQRLAHCANRQSLT
eukprot:scaffold1146_cov399-Prasinococcus_capsulatus_cf.AAC.42